jgi:hypothetical protein
MAELEIFENSSYDELAANALRKLELSNNDKNLRLMREQIKNKVETYVRQLSRGVRNIERQSKAECIKEPSNVLTWLPKRSDTPILYA